MGAGVVGLAHAWHATRVGLRVVVVERDEHAVGASVRNFGHICTTAQAGADGVPGVGEADDAGADDHQVRSSCIHER